jgi:hypothetical protein
VSAITVAQWLNRQLCGVSGGIGLRIPEYRRVVLRELVPGERIQEFVQGNSGMTYWGTDRQVPTATSVAAMQLPGFGNQESLLAKLTGVSDDTGLGSSIIDSEPT